MAKYEIRDWFWIDEGLKIKAIKTAQSASWYARYNLPGIGQRKQSLKTSSKKQARLNGYALARKIASGERPHEKALTATITDAVAARRTRLVELDRVPETIAHYDRLYKQLINHLPRGGKTQVSELTPAVLESFERALRDRGMAASRKPNATPSTRKTRPYLPSTIENAMCGVLALVRFAVRRRMIDRDPSIGYELPHATRRAIEIFTSDELDAIYADPDPGMADIWHFLTLSCLRVNELTWLTKEDVIRDGNHRPKAIHVRRKTCPYTQKRWRPKHNKERVVPLPADAADIVERAVSRSGTAWVFEAPDTASRQTGKWQGRRLLQKLKKRLRECGIRHGHLHILRHTGATFLANDARMPITHVQRFLGHANMQTTSRYIHTNAEDVAASVSQVDYSRLASNSRGTQNKDPSPGSDVSPPAK